MSERSERIIILRQLGVPWPEVARRMNRSASAVRAMHKMHGRRESRRQENLDMEARIAAERWAKRITFSRLEAAMLIAESAPLTVSEVRNAFNTFCDEVVTPAMDSLVDRVVADFMKSI